jgi:predicted nucleotidyltransferase
VEVPEAAATAEGQTDRDALLVRLTAALRADERIRAAWLTGSLGRGAGDRYSDLDVLVAVADADRPGLLDDWSGLADSVASIVHTQRLGTAVVNHITDGWLRFDASFVDPGDLSERSADGLLPLFDRDDLATRLGGPASSAGPSAATVGRLTREFLRILGLLPVVLGRDEYVVGASGAGLARTLLIQLMVEEVAAPDPGGALHLRGLLPPDRLAQLAALPPIAATRESVLAVHLAVADLFLPLARTLADRSGTPWPAEMLAALREHLDRELGVALSA